MTDGISYNTLVCRSMVNYKKSSAVAEMGYRGHNRHGPKIGGFEGRS